jgi:hypothetical protein
MKTCLKYNAAIAWLIAATWAPPFWSHAWMWKSAVVIGVINSLLAFLRVDTERR